MDDYKNYAYSTLATGITIGATSCTVATGTGTRFPSTAFDAVIWDASYPSATAAVLAGAGEQVRVTARSTDALTITRAQGGTSAVALNVSGKTYAVAQVLTEDAFEKLASKVLVGTAMAALAIDTGNLVELNTKTVSANSTFTFSPNPPAPGKVFHLRLTEGGGADRTIIIPSSYSSNRGAAIESFTLAANATADLSWQYDGSTYFIFGDPVTATQVKTALAIAISDTTGTVPYSRGGTGLTTLGTVGQVPAVNAAENGIEWVDNGAGTGDVTAASNFSTDNRLIRSDGTTKGVQASAVQIDDDGTINVLGDSIPGSIALADADATAPETVAITAATDITTSYAMVLPAAVGTSGQVVRIASIAGNVATLEFGTVSGSGTVTKVSVVTANGFSGSVATDTSTPAITLTLGAGAVALSQMANLAQDQFIGRTTASTGVPETATITAAARTVLDDTTVSAMVDTLGGTAATGTGAIVRATSPTLVTPVLGTPSSGTLTSCTVKTELPFACSDETTAITTGTAKLTYRATYAMTLSDAIASVTTAPTGATIVIDINVNGSTILSTKLSIDATEKTSTTAASAVVISNTAIAVGDEITVDFDQVGATIAGTGVKVTLIGTRS